MLPFDNSLFRHWPLITNMTLIKTIDNFPKALFDLRENERKEMKKESCFTLFNWGQKLSCSPQYTVNRIYGKRVRTGTSNIFGLNMLKPPTG